MSIGLPFMMMPSQRTGFAPGRRRQSARPELGESICVVLNWTRPAGSVLEVH
jgi:hypothetical protein